MAWQKIWIPEGVSVDQKLWVPEYRNILDHGFIGLIDFMGSDQDIADAARVSYQKGTKRVSGTEGLIRYLLRSKHSSPFEMAEVKFHVKAPIFVFRQWHRHRMANVNEQSGRYSVLEDQMYIPAYEDAGVQAKDNKQGRAESLSMNDYLAVVAAMEQNNYDSYGTYQYLLGSETQVIDGKEQTIRFPPPDAINLRKTHHEAAAVEAIQKLKQDKIARGEVWNPTEADLDQKIDEYFEAAGMKLTSKEYPGLARELARIGLPVSTYSQMYWKSDLWNLFRFLMLRMDGHAQKEIRVYADAAYEMVQPLYPMASKAFQDYIFLSKTLSRMDQSVILEMIRESWNPERTPNWIQQEIGPKLGMSRREIDELINWMKPEETQNA